MLTYIYQQGDMWYLGARVTMTLKVNLLSQDEVTSRGEADYAISLRKHLERGEKAVEIQDGLSGQIHYCSYDLLLEEFPNVNLDEYVVESAYEWKVKEGYSVDPEAYEEDMRRRNMGPYHK